MAHGIPYVATATVAGLRDLEDKVQRAMEFRGARYLHVLVPCPLGWGHASGDTIKIARLAEQTGLFPVFEAVGGEVINVSPIRKLAPVEEYLKLQNRYAHLFKSEAGKPTIARLQMIADANIARYGLLDSPDSQDGLPPNGQAQNRAGGQAGRAGLGTPPAVTTGEPSTEAVT
jgi:pyruvate ferredoxin oxidoreductase beta subunit